MRIGENGQPEGILPGGMLGSTLAKTAPECCIYATGFESPLGNSIIAMVNVTQQIMEQL